MPNFDARITAGVTLEVWVDPPVLDGLVVLKPSRLNPKPAYPHKYRRVELGATLTVKATVAGVEGPMDATLGGNLFSVYFAELPVWPPPLVTLAGAQSSVATFTPKWVGHHLLVVRRQPLGGGVALPFFVEMTV